MAMGFPKQASAQTCNYFSMTSSTLSAYTEGSNFTKPRVSATTLNCPTGSDGNTRVRISVTGTGVANAVDFTAISDHTLTIRTSGVVITDHNVPLEIEDDEIPEVQETVTVRMEVIGGTDSDSISFKLNDNDGGKNYIGVFLTPSPATVSEGAGNTTVTVTAKPTTGSSFPSDETLTVSVSGSGTASAVDFATVASFNMALSSGSSNATGTFTLTPTNDTVDETDEEVTVSGTSTNTNVQVQSGKLALTDNESPAITLSASPSSVSEGASSTVVTVTATINDSVTFFSSGTVTVAVGASGDSASEGTDYGTVGNFDIAIPAGSASATGTFSITPTDDSLDENNETISIGGSGTSPSGDSISFTSTQITITDNDPEPSLSIGDVSVAENVSSGKAEFTVTLGAASGRQVTVEYATSNGTATAGSDYTSASGTLTFAVGDTSKTVEVSVTDDSVDEADETFTVTLSSASNASISDATATGTITDNDPEPSLSIGDVSVAENVSSGKAEFTVTLGAASGRQVTVEYATSNGTATAGSDYTSASGTLTFAVGDTSETVEVSVTDDSVDEADETFTVTLSSASNASISDATATGTITDNDPEPSLSIGDVSVAENVSSGKAEFTVTLGAASGRQVTVEYATSNGTATAGSDYTSASGTLTFAVGDTSETVEVSVTDDSVDEADETFTVTLSSASNASISDATATGTITDNDPEPSLSIGDVSVAENVTGGKAEFTVTLGAASGRQVTVEYDTSNGTATAGSDYTSASGTLTFAVGDTSETVEVSVTDDSVDEADETFTVTLSSASNASISDATATGTITNDDNPSLSVGDVSVAENVTGGKATVTVSLSRATNEEVTVEYDTSNGTATSGSDYTSASGTLTFTSGQSSAETFTVSITADTTDEADETFTVTLSEVSDSATISDGTGVVTITNDDNPSLSVGDVSVAENVTGGKATVTVSLSRATNEEVTVEYATSNGTATSGSDYTSASGTLTFTSGQSSAETFTVSITADTTDEADETFTVTLSEVSDSATIDDGTGVVTITNDDNPSLSVGDVSVAENVTGGKATVTVSLSRATNEEVTVEYATSNGTATSGSDYTSASGTLTFTSGQSSAETFTVSITADTTDEADETFTVTLSEVSDSATIDDGTGVVTITNDDNPSLSVGDVSVAENVTGGKATVTVSLSRATNEEVTVEYATSNGTATSGSDYTSASGTLTFTSGQSSAETFTVSITADTTDEADETFTVTLSEVSDSATIDDGTGVVTITNDDNPSLSVGDVSVAENVTGGKATVTVSLSRATNEEVTVEYDTSNGTATSGSDYTSASGTLTFTSGQSSAETFTVSITSDTTDEADETFTVTLSEVSDSATIDDGTGVVTITNDDNPSLSVGDVSVAENVTGGKATVTVSLSRATNEEVTVEYATSNGTATSGSDYTSASGTLTFTSGQSSAETFTVSITSDTTDEADETFTVTLSEVSDSATIDDGTGVVTITNDDNPSLSVGDVSVAESVTGGNATVTVSINRATNEEVTVEYATSNGTATAGSDYTSASGTLTFTSGQSSAETFTVSITADTTDEADETFTVTLSEVSDSATIDDGTGVVTITNDDNPSLSVGDVSVAENVTGGKATVTVSLSRATNEEVTVEYDTSNGTATSGSDYTSASGTLTFTSGQSSAETFTVSITADTTDEADETFTVTLSEVSDSATIDDGTGVVTITNDDNPSLSVGDVSVAENVTGGKATVTVSLSRATNEEVTVEYDTSNGTATSGSDYTSASGTLTFTSGQSSAETFTVSITSDTTDEADETFTVTLSEVSDSATISDGTGVVTITNDDNPSLSVGDVSVAENVTGGKATVTVSLSRATNEEVTVEYDTSNGTATSGSDYTSASGTLTFTSGQSSAETFTVSITADTTDEADETFTVTLSEVSDSATIDDGTGVVTITNDDNPSLSVGDVSVAENVTGGKATVTVSLSRATNEEVTVEYATSNGTATAGSDYTSASGTLTFTSGQSSAETFTVSITSDTTDEADETFTVTLSEVSDSATIDDGTGVVTITNDDNPSLSVGDVSVAENVTGGKATVTVSLSRATNEEVTVEYATSNGTATSGSDYTSASGTLTFTSGQSSAETFTVAITTDTTDEADETFTVTLSEVSDSATIDDGTGVVTITNDDNPELSVGDVSVAESVTGGNATVTVSLNRATNEEVTVEYATSNGTATAGSDYTSASGTLTFTSGQSSAETFTVAITTDTTDEADETFTVTLSEVSDSATIDDGTGVVTITDDDAAPGLSIGDVSVSEDVSAGEAVFTVSLSAASGRQVTVEYATSNGTATAGSDYTSASGTLMFSAGDTSKTVEVSVTNDSADEADETFTVTLSSASNASISDSTATGTITNDDNPELSVGDVSVAENVTGGKATVTVSLSRATNEEVTVEYATSNGTATAGSDYTSASGTLTFTSGQSSAETFTVAITTDTTDEADETFTVTLSEVSDSATIDDGTGVVTITNDDNPSLSVGDVSVAENVTGGKATVTVSLSRATNEEVTVEYATSNGTATAGSDYTSASGTLTFTSGQSSAETFTVAITTDTTDEADETFTVTLSEVSDSATIDDGTGVVTITNDDNPELSVGDVSVAESVTGGNATVTVSINRATNEEVTVEYATSNGTATAGSDYTSASGTLTFTSGQSSAETFTVAITTDTTDEADETFTVTLSEVSDSATIDDGTGVVTITDDDAAPGLSIGDVSVSEDVSAGEAVFTVSLSAASGRQVTVEYATSNGTATAGSDYTSASGTLTFSAGDTSETVEVSVTNDSADEADETFTVTLSSASNASISDSTATGTITNDDNPSLSVGDVSVAESVTGGNATVTVSINRATNEEVTVEYATSNGTATAGSDYTSASGTLTFTSGQSSAETFTVSITADTTDEADETFTVTLSEVSDSATIDDGTGVVTITNDDNPELSVGDVSVAENVIGGKATVTVSLSRATNEEVTVEYATSNGTATAGSDYTSASGTLTFTSGQSSAETFTVAITTDTTDEADETFTVTLSEVSDSATIDDGTGVVTITDDDAAPGLSIGDVSVSEDVSAGEAVFTVSLSAASGRQVTVEYATSNGTATAGSDYTSASGTLTFSAGDTSKTVEVSVTNDSADEADETFTVTLSSASNASISDSTATGTITNDDNPELSVGDVSVAENVTGGKATVTVSLSRATNEEVTVEYATSNGTATAGSDYTSASGTLTFTSGQSSAETFTVAITTDTTDEADETFTVTLSEVSDSATIDDGTGVVTITNDDNPSLSVGDVSVAENVTGGKATVTVSLSRATNEEVTVEYATSNGTATAGSDYTSASGTLTFTSGQSSAETFTVAITTDTTDEADETFTVTLSEVSDSATIDDGTGVVTITNDDNPELSVGDVSVAESVTGGNATVTVSINRATNEEVTVEYATSNGTATAGSDYTSASGTLTFTSGQSSAETFTVAITTDTTDEADETFTVTLSEVSDSATIDDGTGVVTITDDDAAPGLSIGDVSVSEDVSAGEAVFTVSLSAASGRQVTVEYATSNGTATAGSDYTSASGTLTFSAGDTSETVEVSVTNDSADEADETFTVTLSSASNASISDSTATGTITNDDNPSLSVGDVSVAESVTGGNATVTVSINRATNEEVTVEYATSNGTATAGSDYTSASGTLTFTSGQSSAETFTVAITTDTTDEADETFTVTLSEVSDSATIDDGTGVVTITNDDNPELSVGDVSVAENVTGGKATVTVSLSRATNEEVTVEYATSNGTATSGSDYTSASGTLTFTSGQSSAETFTVSITADTTDEADETFTVTLSDVSDSATISDGTGVVTITDDDAAPGLSIGDVSVSEGVAGGKAKFTVSLGAASGREVTVEYATSDGTATSGSDYTSASGTLTFAAGDTSKTVEVSVTNDSVDEADETFTVTLSSAVNVTISDSTATGTITNDDNPSLSVGDVSVAENVTGGKATVTVSLSRATNEEVTVEYATSNGTATAGSDYTSASGTLTFTSGQSSAETFTVAITTDTTDEADETFTVTLSEVSDSATIDDGTGVVTITNDDNPSLSVGDVSVAENVTGGKATVTVSLSRATNEEVTVEYATSNGTATAGSDYTSASGTLTFTSGQSSAETFTVAITTDTTDEADETFTVTLSEVSDSATIDDGTGVVTITNDDNPELSVGDVSVAESVTGGNATVTVSINRATNEEVTVEYATSNGTATAGSDYTSASGTLTFTSGQSSAETFTVAITTDTTDEADETFTVTLSEVSDSATIDDGTGVVTITDDDAAPGLSIGDVSVSEDVSAGEAVFTVSLSAASGRQVTVEYATSNGTATAGSDYTSASGTLTFSAGDTSETVEVSVTNDSADEADETFTVTLSSASNASISDSTATGTITNDDNPSLSVGDVSVAESVTGGNATVTVSINRATNEEVTVEYATSNGTATAGSDYTSASGTLTFTSGQSSAETFTVAITTDTTDEADETFTVTLSEVSDSATIDDGTGVVTITNDDNPSLSVGDVSVAENVTGGKATVTVSLSRATNEEVTVEYATSNGTATAGSDYTSASGTLTFTSGQSSAETFTVAITTDTTDEADETFTVTLSDVSDSATISDGTGVVTITDDDAAPGLSIGDVSVSEGVAGGKAKFTVSLGAASGREVTVEYATSDGTATSGSDYTSASGTLTFSAGDTSETVEVSVTNDSADEADETFTVTLSSASNASISDSTATGTITNDDNPSLSVGDVSVAENVTGGNATVTVSINRATNEEVTVEYATSNGTATAGSDYTSASGTLTFTSGQSSAETFTVAITTDTTDEADETFTVTLSEVSDSATIDDGTGVVTITNDDNPSLSVGDVSVAENVTGGKATVTVSLSRATNEEVTVEYATSNGTATAGSDYTSASGTLTFTSGQSSAETFTVAITTDTTDEADETFTVTLSEVSDSATIDDGTGVVTITNDDNPSLSVGDVSVAENVTGGKATVTVSLSRATNEEVTVEYATSNGTATSGSDYTSASGTLTFTSGQSSAETFTVSITADTTDEADETFTVTLSDVSDSATINDGTGVVTITDDDAAPGLSIGDVSVSEGVAGGKAKFTVSLGAASGREVTVEYATSDGTATSGSDYTSASGTLTFAAGDTSKTVEVSVTNDSVDEADETFTVTLSSAVNVTISDSTATGTITNDDNPSLSVGDVSVAENVTGGKATVTVSLSRATNEEVTVEYATSNGTATAGSDYTSASGTLTFTSGQSSAETFTVAITTDTTDEADETFTVTLSEVSDSATIDDGTGVVTITDDDAAPGLSIGDVSVSEDVSAGKAVFTVSLSAASGRQVTVEYATSNGTATAGSDYTSASGTLTFSAGDTSETVEVSVTNDSADEADETFTVTLSNATNASISDAAATGTITDNDSQPGLSIGDKSVSEGVAGGKAKFTVTLGAASGKDVTVEYATSDGTATSGSDYTSASGTLTFAAGDTSKTVEVSVTNDSVDEADETFTVTLSSATNASISDATAVGTITDDDGSPALSIGDVSVAENVSAGKAVFTVSLSPASGKQVTVRYATSNGTAAAGSDYTSASGTLTFSAGDTSETVEVSVTNDSTDEADETFTVTLSSAANASISDSTATGTITNDDNPSLSVGDVSVAENVTGGNATVTVSINRATNEEVTVEYATSNGTATAGSDYTSASGTLTFTSGQSSAEMFTVGITSDTTDEADETFTVTLSEVSDSATINDGIGVVTITNDDNPSLSVEDVTVDEDVAGGKATVTVSINRATNEEVTVEYATSDGTATAGSDYTSASGTLTFTSGQSSDETFTVSITDDSADEPDETFTVTLSSTANASISDATAVGTITDDDSTPGLSIGDKSVAENVAGGKAKFTVTLGAASGKDVTVEYATSDGTATVGSDYTATSGTLTFSAGDTSKTVEVSVTNDTTDEADETFTVTLSDATNASISDATATGTITDDDAAPGLSIGDVSVSEGVAGGKAKFTVSLGAASGREVTVEYATSDGTATSGSDYTSASGTLTFAAGDTSKTVEVSVTNDSVDEADETFTVTLSSATNASISDATAVGTITDDDAAPGLSIGDVSVAEGVAGGKAKFTVTLGAVSGKEVTVEYATSDGTAKAGSDYTSASGTLTLSAGDTSKTVEVSVTNDSVDEADETFTVTLSSATNATISDATAVGTITDDDVAPGLSIGDVSVAEGVAGGKAKFTVTLGAASGKDVTVKYATSDGTAKAGSDYTSASGTLTFSAGDTSKTVEVSVADDSSDEPDEMFTVTLSDAANASISDATAEGTITDNDGAPGLLIGDMRVDEDVSGGTAVFRVRLSPASGKEVTVEYATSDGTAAAGSDYTSASGTLTFSAGDTSKAISIAIKDDDQGEEDEDFTLTLSNALNATIDDDTGVVTIMDDDDMPSLSVGGVTVSEGITGGRAVFTVSVSSPTSRQVTVEYATSDGTATDGADYTGGSGILTFAPGETGKTISFAVADDSLDEEDETFTLTLSGPSNATLAVAVATALIVDDDEAPVLSMADVTVAESAGTAELTASLSGPSGKTVSVDYATSDGTAVAGSDYEAVSGSLMFAPGETEKTISVRVIDDAEIESEESFTVRLSGESNVSLAGASALVTIEDDDKEKFAERLKEVNESVLPEISRAMATSTVSAVVSRVGHSVSRNVQNVFGLPVSAPRRKIAFARDPGFYHDEFGIDEHLYEDPRSWRETLGESFMFSLAGGIDRGVLKKTPAPAPVEPRIVAPVESPSGPGRLGVWVAGDYMRVSGPEDRQIDWDGRMLSGHLGADVRLGNVIVGVAASRSDGAFDYTDTGGGSHNVGGRYTSRMNSVHPYLGWSSSREGTGTWVTAGYGSGEIEIDDENIGRKSSSDAKLWTVAAGGTLRLLTRGSSALALKAEAWLSNLKVEDNEDLIRGVEVRTNRVKVALSGSRSLSLGSGTLTPSVELGLRRDGGDGYNSLDSEVGAGLRYMSAARGITVEVNGRRLLFSREGLGEWGAGGMVRYDHGADRRGLMFSALPSYGDAASGVKMLWDDRRAGPGAGGSRGSLRLETEIGYGIPTLGGSGLLTPYGIFIPWDEGNGDSYGVGSRLEVGQKFEVSLEGRREGRGDGVFEHGLMLRSSMRW